MNGSGEWLEKNIGTFLIFATLQELKNLNVEFSAVSDTEQKSNNEKGQIFMCSNEGKMSERITNTFFLTPKTEVIKKLSPKQKAELILDPDSSASKDATFVREVLTTLTLSGNVDQLTEFFQSFAEVSKKVNIKQHLFDIII